jgi:hypothetical protein
MYVVAALLPPLLPTVFVVSVGISAKRLQIKRVTCKNPEGILIAGKVSFYLFAVWLSYDYLIHILICTSRLMQHFLTKREL